MKILSTIEAFKAISLISVSYAFVIPRPPLCGNSAYGFSQHASSIRMVSSKGGAEFTANLPGAPFDMAIDGRYFDPAGLTKNQNPEVIKKWREAELKHGRIAMLASLGILVAEVRKQLKYVINGHTQRGLGLTSSYDNLT